SAANGSGSGASTLAAGGLTVAGGLTAVGGVLPVPGGFGIAGSGAAGRRTGDCPNTIVEPASGSAFGLGGGALRLPVWNIIVRPAPSAAAADEAAGFPPVEPGLEGAAGGATGRAGGWPNTIVEPTPPPGACGAGLAGAGRGAAGMGACSGTVAAGSAGRVTLNVFWHLPHRMVRPWGPTRASSTR